MTCKTMASTADISTPHSSTAMCELDETYMAIDNWITHLYETAGRQLENLSSLSPFKIGTFKSLVERFWQRYSVAMREEIIATSRYFGGYEAGMRRLQVFLRQFAYARAGLLDGNMYLYCPLTSNWNWTEMRHARRMVASRMLRYVQHVARCEDPHPLAGPYLELNLKIVTGNRPQRSDQYLAEHLPDGLKWLVDWSLLPSLETLMLIMHMRDIQWIYQSWKHQPRDIIDLARQYGAECAPVLEEYTTSYTEEAMMSQEDKICHICTKSFGTELNEELQTEPAVITHCGHVAGAQCLQRWANERGTCPFCRRDLCTEEQLLPLSVRSPYRTIQGLMVSLRDLDPHIDHLLAHERPDIEIHGQEYLNLLKKLRDYSVGYHRGIVDIVAKIKDEGGKMVRTHMT